MVSIHSRSIYLVVLLSTCGSAFTWRLRPTPSPKWKVARSIGSTVMAIIGTTTPEDEDHVLSLAAGYLVECRKSSSKATMLLRKVSDMSVDECYAHSEGASAWACLHGLHAPTSSHSSDSQAILTADFTEDPPRITISDGQEDSATLVLVLARVLAQWSLQQFPQHHSIELPGGLTYSVDKNSTLAIQELFDSHGEVVEMVDRSGSVLGRIPRLLVHQHNILHRGIGLFVTADRDNERNFDSQEARWYVHRRTSTKRIFPDLYDMFVGGVALAGEDQRTTALREVQEELGLAQGRLSDTLLTCIVCTDYNRCFVTLFGYQTNPQDEAIRWQEEEVACGEFCSYQVIQAAADRSIQRLVEQNKWPGQLPAIQSELNGSLNSDAGTAGGNILSPSDWTGWDFVPDGLLVWEAWLRYRRTTASVGQQ